MCAYLSLVNRCQGLTEVIRKTYYAKHPERFASSCNEVSPANGLRCVKSDCSQLFKQLKAILFDQVSSEGLLNEAEVGREPKPKKIKNKIKNPNWYFCAPFHSISFLPLQIIHSFYTTSEHR